MSEASNGRGSDRGRTVKAAVAIAAVSVSGLALAATSGAAGFKPGGYLGSTSQSKTIIFNATKKKVTTLSIDVRHRCQQGGDTYEYNTSVHGLKAKINSKGVFKATQSEFGTTALVKGKLQGKKASGTARATMKSGTSECDTGKLKWTAKLS